MAEAQRNSPMLNFPPMAGPLIVTYGTVELPELCHQLIDYAQAWAGRGLPGDYRGCGAVSRTTGIGATSPFRLRSEDRRTTAAT